MPVNARRDFLRGSLALGAAASGLVAAGLAHAAGEVKFAADPAHLQPGLEAAHVPRITLEKAPGAEVAYGKTPAGDFYRVAVQARHEATAEHHIFSIALWVNGRSVGEYRIDPVFADAAMPIVVAVQRLKPGDEITAITSCNVHGQWGSRMTV
jgi:desulfoferrodoxin (superoxide reductase-like protein)